MEHEEFLGSLTSAWLGEERRAAPRESLLEKVERAGPEATRAYLEPIIEHYQGLVVHMPQAAEMAEALSRLHAELDGAACARVEELYAQHMETVRAELGHLEVRVTYSPWVDNLKAQLQAFVRGQQLRGPILEALAELEEQFALNRALNQESERALGSRADETARKVFGLSERGYAGGLQASRLVMESLEARDLEGVGEGLRALNEAFSLLTQAKELCERTSRREV